MNIDIPVERTKINTHHFVKVFPDSVLFLNMLSNSERKVFTYLYTAMDYKNIVNVSPGMRKVIVCKEKMDKGTLSSALSSLKAKKLLLTPITEEAVDTFFIVDAYTFMVNPNIVSKASKVDLLKETALKHFNLNQEDLNSFLSRILPKVARKKTMKEYELEIKKLKLEVIESERREELNKKMNERRLKNLKKYKN